MVAPVLPVYGVTPFTMLDFPGHTACIIWFSGCNMRCGYCHNPQIVRGRGEWGIDKVLAFLDTRQGLLDGVVISGGEATIYPGLADFIATIRRKGFAIKLDTNGTRSTVVADLLARDLLDYVALDYKSPPGKFKAVTGLSRFTGFDETLGLLCAQQQVPFEVRTTVHTDLLDEDDVTSIIHDLERRRYTGTFYVQNFRGDDDRPTLGNLPPQQRVLDMTKLPRPTSFQVEYRNF